MDTITVQTCALERVTAVGDADTFAAAVAGFSRLHADSALALARMLAYAHHAFHARGDVEPMNAIARGVQLPKDAGARLERILMAIPRQKGEGSASKEAVKFANESAAAFYDEGTRASKARAEKARAAREEKARAAVKTAQAEVAAAKAAGKAEAQSEAEEAPEFGLTGPGLVMAITAAEFAELRDYLATIREAVAAQDRKNVRASAQVEQTMPGQLKGVSRAGNKVLDPLVVASKAAHG